MCCLMKMKLKFGLPEFYSQLTNSLDSLTGSSSKKNEDARQSNSSKEETFWEIHVFAFLP